MAKKPDDMLARLTKTLADTKPTKAPEAVRQKCRKISVSLHPDDEAFANSIMGYMIGKGHRVPFSQAIKLALRTATIDEGLIDALEQIKKDDGRGKW